MRDLYRAWSAGILIALALHVCSAQTPTIRTSSYYTFIYKLTDQQAGILYEKLNSVDSTFLNQLYDLYPTDSVYKKKLPVGHYLFIQAEHSEIITELRSVNNVDINMLNNHRDLLVVVHDTAGRELKNLAIELSRKKVLFHKSTQTYRLRKSNRQGLLSVTHQSHTSYFEIDRRYNNKFFARTGRKIVYSAPVRIIVAPFRYIGKNVSRIIHGYGPFWPNFSGWSNTFEREELKGYMAFNKPIYKPGDSVKLKAFLTNKKGKHYAKPADIYLISNYPYSRKKLGTISPARKGSYPFEFVLSDSLNLKLDQRYNIELHRKQRELFTRAFYYEQYELKQNTYSVQNEKDPASGQPILILKGTDSNEMPLYDVQVEILVESGNAKRFYQPHVFVADTLWFHKTSLESSGETRIILPDSLFPEADISYTAEVSFYNSERERTTRKVALEYLKNRLPVTISLQNDSLVVNALSGFIPNEPLTLETFTAAEKFTSRPIVLPYRELLNHSTRNYKVRFKNFTAQLAVDTESDNLNVMSNRTADSLLISTQNPRNINFRYFLFKNQQLIESGQTESLTIVRGTSRNDVYYLSLQYIWAGTSQNQEFTIPFEKKILNVEVAHPVIVYPGQEVNFDISVKDAYGKPVKVTDLTAYAISKKFPDPGHANVPDLSRPVKNRKIYNTFSPGRQNYVTRRMENSYWKKTLGLDSLAFYDLLDPDSGYFEVRLPADTAQLAPFVVGYGIEKPSVIYVDNIPVYYRGVTGIQPYSFAVRPGKHTVKLRVMNALITVMNVEVHPNQKLIFSVDKNDLPQHAVKVEMPFMLTDVEAKELSRYFVSFTLRNNKSRAYVKQGNRYHLLQREDQHYTRDFFTGPFYPGWMTYVTEHETPIELAYEPFYRYEFSNIIKLRESNVYSELKKQSLLSDHSTPLTDEVLTGDSIQAYWTALNEMKLYSRQFPELLDTRLTGKLTLELPVQRTKNQRIAATFIVNLDKPDEYFVFPGLINQQMLSPGQYEAAMLLADKRYMKVDSLIVKPNGLNYYYIEHEPYRPADSLSYKIIKLLSDLTRSYVQGLRVLDMQTIRNLYYQQASSGAEYNYTVMGQVTSADDGSPLPGVSVVIKGTAIGTMTDANGYYSLNRPSNAVLVFSFISLKTQEVVVTTQSSVDIVMENDVAMLNEVVVVAGGLTVQRRELGNQATVVRGTSKNAMEGLSGKVPGLLVSALRSGVNPDYRVVLRGQRSLVSNQRALVIIDGRISSAEEIEKIEPASITGIEFLQGDAAASLYGAQAANGVLLFSTKKGATHKSLLEMAQETLGTGLPEELPGNSLRKNFRDDAFWKPNLITDAEGKTAFHATFPDDITGWNVRVLAMSSKRKTGQASFVVRSFKPMMAQLFQPQFLIEGDQTSAIGRITAYNAENLTVKRVLKINDQEIKNDLLEIKNSAMDSIPLLATSLDSIVVEYTVTRDRYKDGELRIIPVLKKGTLEAVGTFNVFNKDSTFTVPAGPGELIIHADADLAEVLLSEINYLRQYRYECNEQMASRLLGLLSAKQIMKFRGEPFKLDREVEKVVRRLSANQNPTGGWSWWNSGPESDTWVTLHVANSLTLAKEMGYDQSFDLQGVFEYLESMLAAMTKDNYQSTLKFLLEHKRMVVVQPFADGIRRSPASSLHDKILANRLLQLAGEKVDWSSIQSMRSETLKGNYYWGEEKNSLYDNRVLTTLLAYEIAQAAGADAHDLTRIRNFFLEARERTWRNTYESACVIRAITSSANLKGSSPKSSLTFSGGISQSFQKFPATVTKKASEPVLVSVKTTGSPIYVTVYRETWNPAPKRNESKFKVETSFGDSKNLMAGKPVALNVTVEVKYDAEYVMIEVPIPAGCSYQRKSGSSTNGEIHREHYMDKTNIYCRFLKKGIYQYTIYLLPRFSGNYTLNPAVAESMYFPVLHGQNEIKSVVIKQE